MSTQKKQTTAQRFEIQDHNDLPKLHAKFDTYVRVNKVDMSTRCAMGDALQNFLKLQEERAAKASGNTGFISPDARAQFVLDVILTYAPKRRKAVTSPSQSPSI